jgi:hypothetical protein
MLKVNRDLKEGKPVDEIRQDAELWPQRLAKDVKGTFESKGQAYCNDYSARSISFDIGDDGRQFIETILLGVTVDQFIAQSQRKLIEATGALVAVRRTK